MTKALPRFVIPAATYILILVGWEFAGQSLAGPGAVLIPPSTIAFTIANLWNIIIVNTGITLMEAGLGFLFGTAAALALAVVIDRFRLVGEGLYRVAMMVYAVPIIAIAAPLVATLGLGITSKIAVAGLAAYFPVLVNLTGSLRTLDTRIAELGRVLAMGYRTSLFRLRSPAVLPSLLSSFKIAAPAAFIGAIIAEWMGAESGLGVMLIQAMFSFNAPLLWSVLLVATLVNGLIVLLFEVLARVVTPWHESAQKEAVS